MNDECLYKEIHKHPVDENKFIQIKIYFRMDRVNQWTNEKVERGYIANVVPIEDGKIKSMSGFNYLLYKCERRSKFGIDRAKEVLEKKRDKFINYFLKK